MVSGLHFNYNLLRSIFYYRAIALIYSFLGKLNKYICFFIRRLTGRSKSRRDSYQSFCTRLDHEHTIDTVYSYVIYSDLQYIKRDS